MLTRRQFIGGLLGTALVSGALLEYAIQAEPFWVETVSLGLPVVGLPASLNGARLVHLSDLHVGGDVPDDFLLEQFERIAGLDPDIVVLTGDLMQRGSEEYARRMYSRLPLGRLATLCILGNHDYGPDWSDGEAADRVVGVLQDVGATVLRNEVATVEGMQVVGMDDLWARRFDPAAAFASADMALPTICLSHNPDTADLPGWDSFSGWILAGHTHGGQCKPPLLAPPLLPVTNRRYVAGAFDLDGARQMYVNRGLGFLRQVRFNARPEVTVFTLERA